MRPTRAQETAATHADDPELPRAVSIVGPTASGKTRLTERLAERFDVEVVNADALQAYRHLSIGTDKPPEALRARIPHHLVDILEPDERFSAGDFARRAAEAIRAIRARGRIPLVVGGSGLYQRALFEGLSRLPRAQPAHRAQLEDDLSAGGLGPLREELREVDPETASRLEPGDTQRILRALEVYRGTGRSLSAWLSENPPIPRARAALRVGLTVPRSLLYDRIADRVYSMVERGWKAEVERLIQLGFDRDAPAFQAIGYRHMVRCVRGEMSLDEALDETIRATRRYAKRQMTWFRKESSIQWISGLDFEEAMPAVLEAMESEELLVQ